MTVRSILAALALILLPACSPPVGPGEASGPSDGPPRGGGDVGLPELNWTPGEIQTHPIDAVTYVAQSVDTSADGFEGEVGTRIGDMHKALEGSNVEKSGPAFVILADPWGTTMRATVGFPVVAGTAVKDLPEGFSLESLPACDTLAMVFQGPRGGLAAADAALLTQAGKTEADGSTRVYVLLDRPESAGPAGPKTKVMLRL